MNSITTKKIIEGFEEDLDQIISKYIELSPDLRLEVFFKFWDESHLDCIFANRFDPRELFEAITEMNKTLVTELINTRERNESYRATILYFMLCLFQKQPHRLKRKFRLLCEDTILIDKLGTQITHTMGHRDALYAWEKLKLDDAIDMVEDRTIFGPSMLNARVHSAYDTTRIQQDLVADAEHESLDFLRQKIEPYLEELANLCDNYEGMRQVLEQSDFSDTVMEIDEKKPLRGFIDSARAIIDQYKSEMNR